MPPQLNIKKQLAESGEGIYVNRWWTGLITNRSPLFVPISALGLQMVARHDAMSDGQNMELSPRMTVVRRPGYPRFCSTVFGAEKPLTFFSFKNTAGTIRAIADTTLRVAQFTATTITTVFTKSTTSQTSFAKVGDVLYMCDGTDLKKWDGTTVAGWGITAPAAAAALSFGAGALSPTIGYKYVFVFKNSSFGHVSTAAPFSASTGPLTAQDITVAGAYSTDTQVDKVDIYRTKDGGSVYYFLAEIANNTAGGTWSYTDSTADGALNTNLIAPINHINDAPPAGASLACFHMGYMCVAVGNKLYFGAGPACTNGVPEESFPPANVFVLPGKITAMVSTSQGLALWTYDDMFVLLGTDAISFYVQKFQSNFGVASQNCVAQDGDLLFLFTTKKQLFSISSELAETGFSIRDKIAAVPAATAYLAVYRAGADEGLFVSDGTANVWRYSITQQIWSPAASVVGGVGCIAECEVDTADFRLLAGRASDAGYILARDTTNAAFYDDTNASPYPGFSTVGALMLAPPGQTATIKQIMLEVLPIGTYPTVAVLSNEVGGAFTILPSPVPDPPMLSSIPQLTITMKRHYLKAAATPLPEQMRFISVKISVAAENAANEIVGLALGT